MISVITPSHKTKYLKDLYECLLKQTLTDWEWVVVLNGEAENITFEDPRVKIFRSDFTGSVGTLKRFASEKAQGDIIVEVDHDDLITPDALEEVRNSFTEGVVFSYSNFAEVNEDWTPRKFDLSYGWEYKPFTYEGHEILECVSPSPIPQHMSIIWFAPNHIRAWKKDTYMEVGGHSDLPVADDHELILKLWFKGKFAHINKCLYIYRVHSDNTWLERNAEVQTRMWQNHQNYIYKLAEKFAEDNNLEKIDLCGGIDKPEGYKSIDIANGDINQDLNKKWKLKDGSVGVIRAHDAIEHLKDPVFTMNEAYRVLTHGGYFLIEVPSTDGVGAWCDPTHVSFWNKRSFRYYTEKDMGKYLPNFKGKFQILKLENEMRWDNVPYVVAHLVAIKDGNKIHGKQWQK